jgi:flavonol synthase
LSYGRYKAAKHRVTVNKEKTRMSWPTFVEPPGELVVGPLQQLAAADSPAKYKPKKYKDYQFCKSNLLPQ